MRETVVPLLSVLLGAVLGGAGTLLAERARAANARRHDLFQARRQVELEAIDQVHDLLAAFNAIFVHNHNGKNRSADRLQAAALDRFLVQLDQTARLSARVRAVASDEAGQLMREIQQDLLDYFYSLTDRFPAEQTNEVAATAADKAERLARIVREDLGTDDLAPISRG